MRAILSVANQGKRKRKLLKNVSDQAKCHVVAPSFVGRPVPMKNGVNWGNGFAIDDANTKIVP